MVFDTERLCVRQLKREDYEAFHEMQSNPEVMKYITGRAQTKEENQASLEECIKCYSQPGNDFWVWAIERKSDQYFIGTCAIVHENNEIGYRLTEKYWGNGYGREITTGLISYALHTLGYTQLYAVTEKENTASVKILDSSVMRFEKEFLSEEEKCRLREYRYP